MNSLEKSLKLVIKLLSSKYVFFFNIFRYVLCNIRNVLYSRLETQLVLDVSLILAKTA